MPPQVSCIIPAYNAAPYLERAVLSLLDCGLSDLEIVIVNDGSKDQTLTVAQMLAQRHPTVTVLQHPEGRNQGVSATRNLGLEHSTGELICLLDGDDYVYPHRFTTALQILNSQREVDGVYEVTELVFADDTARASWKQHETLFGFTTAIPPLELLSHLLKGRCWATSAILFRRTLLEQTGLFDPRLHIAEDCNLWFRMASVGTLIAGDLTRPVSAYWRTTGSAFQPAAAQKIQMLTSMKLFLDWLQRHSACRDLYPQAARQIRDYAVNGIISARTAQNRSLAWQLALRACRLFPGLMLESRLQRQLLSMVLGK